MWNCELSKAFGVLMAFFEISIRNRIHSAMATHYIGHTGPTAYWWDAIASQLGTTTMNKVKDVREKNGTLISPPPSADEIVSRVSFGFWTSVLGKIDQGQADKIMPAIFPHHPLNANSLDWKIHALRKEAIGFIFEMNYFRNRLAHHEPLWKFPHTTVYVANGPNTAIPASTDRLSSITRLNRLLNLYDDVIRGLSSSLFSDLQNSSWRKALTFLLSDRGIKRYEDGRYTVGDIEASSYQLHKNFAFLSKRNEPVRVRRAMRTGIFIPD